MAFYFLATWIHSGLLKKGFVSIDEETISVCMLLGTKKAFWKDLDGISVAEVRGVRFLRLTRSHGRREKQLISIPFSLFAGTDFDRLTETAAYMMERNAKQIETSGPPVGQSENPLDNSSYGVCEKNGTRRNGVALLRALLLSCILLAVDTFIAFIFPFHPGYLEIPVTFLAAGFLLTVYRRKAIPGPVSRLSRILLGFFASFPLVNVPLLTAVSGRPEADPFTVLSAAPVWYAPYFIAIPVLFFCGFSWDKVRRTLRAARGTFLQKRNGFALSRSGDDCTIHLTDYADFDPTFPHETFYLEPGSFLAEKADGFPTAVYLTDFLFREERLNPFPLSLTLIGGKSFYLLNLGERGELAYLYHLCAVICGEGRRIEAIRFVKQSP